MGKVTFETVQNKLTRVFRIKQGVVLTYDEVCALIAGLQEMRLFQLNIMELVSDLRADTDALGEAIGGEEPK